MSDDGSYTWLDLPEPFMLPAGPWRKIYDGDLPMPVSVRIHRHTDGRYVITGLMIGEEASPREITSQTLRQIKLNNILAELFKDFDPDSPQRWTPQTSIRVTADINARTGNVAAGHMRGPGDAALRAFARTYQIELARQPRRAMTAAAKAHKISRATANRWAALCRQRGLLPQPQGEVSPS